MKKNIFILTVLAGLFLAVFLKPAFCADDSWTDDFKMYAGEVKSIPTKNPKRVAIGNPAIADINSVSATEIMVVANSPGTTTLVWSDKFGESTIHIRVCSEDMVEIKNRIDLLLKDLNLPKVSTKANDNEGKVLLLGTVKTAGDLELIRTALGALNAKTTNLIQIDEEKRMIEIEAEVLEIDRGATKTIGLEWPDSMSLLEVASGAANPGLTSPMFRMKTWNRSALEGTIDLLVENGKARVLSRPKLACQSGKEAEMLVGGEVPILSTQTVGATGGSSTEVEYKEYGIKLKILPVLTEEKKIKLTLKVDVIDVVYTAATLGATSAPTAYAYPFTKRSTSTQLYMDSGQTLGISGLIKQKTQEEIKKFPWLGDLPMLGGFFRHRKTESGDGLARLGDTELIVLITPKILPESAVVVVEPPPAQSIKTTTPPKDLELDNQPVDINPPAAVATSLAVIVSDYSRSVAGYLQEKLLYPSAAKMGGIKGEVKLSLHLTRTGQLVDCKIDKSSGYGVLDASALQAAKQNSPYPVFPAGLTEDDIWIQVPIVYNLKD